MKAARFLVLCGTAFGLLLILSCKNRPKPVEQLEAVIKRFTTLSSASTDVDSVQFDVRPSPSGSLVSPYVGTVDYVVPVVVVAWNNIAEWKRVKCLVHVNAYFAYQDGVWVFKELQPDVDRAGAEYIPYNHQLFTVPIQFWLDKESKELIEQHRQRWQTATAPQ